MRDRVFLDTNIIVYLYSVDESDKRETSCNFVNSSDCITSIQAMNEASNVWFRKYNLRKMEIAKYLDEIESVCNEVMHVQRKIKNRSSHICRAYFGCSVRYSYKY